MSNESPWLFNDVPIDANSIPKDAVSFVYEIINLTNDKRYLGKKTLFFSKTRKVKGKKKREKKESDWGEYFGSNVELNEDVKKLGEKNFRRTILRFCKSKGQASYYEAKFIFGTDAIMSDRYYNSWISVRIRSNHLKK